MFEMIFQRSGLDSVFKMLNYRKFAVDDHLEKVHLITNEYLVIQDEKDEIEKEKRLLAVRKEAYEQSKKALDAEKKRIEAEMAAKRDMENQLSDEIESLATDISSLQKKIIEVRSGMFVVDIESVPDTGDENATLSGFMSKAPSGSFGVFSFGAYTHRNGMSQYGTLGRVEGGQNYQQILQHYYGKSPEKKDTSGEIKVKDEGEMDFETDYMYGIGEMPSYWPVEALKVQAVAARSYAYRYYDSGLKICKTESCQVWVESKSEDPPENWKKAVDATQGMIVDDVVGQYSAATGGYLNDSGWDTTDGSHSGDWPGRAWESKAGCPWFYKAWYRKGYSDSSDSCGRKPWMTEEEMADIVNAWLILEEVDVKGDPDTDKILPVTIDDCEIGGVDDDDAYSMD
ncbi:hypothetical protein GF357_05270, partial [Candidatus Dojkabacteria bacterium]|nr:hypothetical protein [Candidatus Dojkabacteria bacterium]